MNTPPITVLKGIGQKRAETFRKLGIVTMQDLIRFFPRDYQDRTTFVPIPLLVEGDKCCVRAIAAERARTVRVRGGMTVSRLPVYDEGGSLIVTFFNSRFAAEAVVPGREYIFFGKVTAAGAGVQMINPEFEPADGSTGRTGAIVPVYRMTAGLGKNSLSQAIKAALEQLRGRIEEPLPEVILQKYHLMGAEKAYHQIHFPTAWESLAEARRRMIFEELFIFSLGLSRMKGRRKQGEGPVISGKMLDAYLKELPFSLTDDQMKCTLDALGDMASGQLMNRLVQGDVGSGKTAVAAACAFCAVSSGFQCALMAPTEILARQHYDKLCPVFEKFGYRTLLLTGAMTPATKRKAQQQMADGEVDFIIGTHALISKGVAFQNLGLVITDEQHRFGVSQRAQLSAKGDCAHVLVMSATPIPRTLALIMYGDMDVSVIRALPPGRTPVKTYAGGDSYRERIFQFIRKQVQQGRQAFVVCPAVEESEDMLSVEDFGEQVRTKYLPDLRVELIHGKMRNADKERIMAAYAAGQADVLVATTVIEVGMDVPNASVMVVENAERFGLSQLHQLRGRVGRGSGESYCILICQTKGKDAKTRMDTLCRTNDGFEIARADLELRGPGDFFGSRQHGLPEFAIADIQYDVQIMNDAQEAAKEYERLCLTPGGAKHSPLIERIEAFFSEGTLFN